MQTRRHSLTESTLNVFSGILIAFALSQLAHEYQHEIQKHIWKGFTWEISAGSNVAMTTVFTLVSIVRGYFWRRHFNSKSKGSTQNG